MAELNYNIEKIFEEMELELIRSMKKSLQNHKNEELKEGFNWEMWQSAKLRELRAYRKRNAAIVGEYMNGIPEEIAKIITEQYNEGADGVDAEVKAAIDNGYITKTTPDFGKVNDKKLNALIDSVNNDFDKVKKAVLRKSTDVYRQTIFTAEMSLAAGAKTLNQAVDMATKMFLSQGLDCITYADGRKVNIASYAKMAVRTAHTRAYLVGEGERRRAWKECLVMVSQYMQCSETCLPWQGRVYVDDVYSGASKADIAHYVAKGYKKLSEAIENGLFHPNCRHSLSTWFEGISTMPKPHDAAEVRHNREQTAKENYCKRQIQKYKRLKAGSVDKENIQKYDKKVKQWKTQIKEVKNSGIANSKESGIIKSITINDFKPIYESGSISKDCVDEIINSLGDDKRYFDNVKIVNIPRHNNGQIDLLRTNVTPNGNWANVSLEINEAIFKDASLEKINRLILKNQKNGYVVIKNLQEAVWHEIGHAKLMYGETYAKAEAITDMLRDYHIDGISRTAEINGDECIAECYVLFRRGEDIPSQALELYNEYMKG